MPGLAQMRPDFTTVLVPPQQFNSLKILAIALKEGITPATGCVGTLLGRGRDTGGLSDYFVVCLVFVQGAKPLRDFPGRLQLVEFGRIDPGLRVRLGIVDDDLHFQGVMIQPPVALGKMCLFAPGIPEGIVPLFVVKPGRFDNECVPILPANGVPQPSWPVILGKRPPVRPDGAPNVSQLKEH